MAFQVNLTSEETQESPGRLQEPVIAPAELEFLGPEEIGDAEYRVINMKWIIQDEDHMGQQFNHVEWEPSEKDFESQNGREPEIKNKLKRLLHVLSRTTTVDKSKIRELLNDVSGEDVEEYWENVRTLVGQLQGRNSRTADFEIKVVGNDYKGGTLKFPRYPSFVRVVGEDPVLEFNDYDRKNNHKYLALQNEEPDDDEEFNFGANVDEDEEGSFDF